MQNLFMFLSVVGGSVLVIQAGANAQLSRAAGSPLAATAIQLSVGAVVLFIAGALGGGIEALPLVLNVPWWHAAGGLASALYVLSTIVLFPRLGAIVTVGLYTAGQMLASVLIDHFGVLGVAVQPASAADIAGLVIVLLGVYAVVRGQAGQKQPPAIITMPGSVAFALVAGALLPLQGVVNALLRAELQAPAAVGFISFCVATAGMVVAAPMAARLLRIPLAKNPQLGGMPWWGWLGGFAGAAYVTTVFTAIPEIGAAQVVALTIAGQQVASVLVDRFGLLGFPRRGISALRLTGVAALLLGVVLIKM